MVNAAFKTTESVLVDTKNPRLLGFSAVVDEMVTQASTRLDKALSGDPSNKAANPVPALLGLPGSGKSATLCFGIEKIARERNAVAAVLTMNSEMGALPEALESIAEERGKIKDILSRAVVYSTFVFMRQPGTEFCNFDKFLDDTKELAVPPLKQVFGALMEVYELDYFLLGFDEPSKTSRTNMELRKDVLSSFSGPVGQRTSTLLVHDSAVVRGRQLSYSYGLRPFHRTHCDSQHGISTERSPAHCC